MTVLHYYTRRGCHLCEVMLEELLPLVRGRAEIELCDVDSDAGWYEKFNLRVPVIEHEGRLVSEYPLNAAAVLAVLPTIAETGE